MRLALISLSTEHIAGHGPVGMLPLFDGNIVGRQVQSARNMGADRIIFLSPTMHGALLQYTDTLKRQDIDAEIVRNARDLGQYASSADDLIFLGDGVFPDRSIEERLSGQSYELIYVVANADSYADFERIDLSHRWLGIALLKAERLSEIAEIPDDWDIGSALVRTAVQSECKRELVSDEEMEADAVPQLLNSDASIAYAKRRILNIRLAKQNFLDRFVSWPLMRKIIPLLWGAPDAKKYMGMASIVCAVIALGLSLIVSPVAPLGLLFLGSMALLLHKRISIFSVENDKLDLTSFFFNLLAMFVLIIAVIRDGQQATLFADVTILLLLFGNFWMVCKAPDNPKLNWTRLDIPLILIILLTASAFGSFLVGIYVSAIFCLMYLIAERSSRFTSALAPDPAS